LTSPEVIAKAPVALLFLVKAAEFSFELLFRSLNGLTKEF